MHVDQLRPALDEGWITEVVRSVKSGKEASVYLCAGSERAGHDLVAAKVYRHRRTFSHDAGYWEGATRNWGRRLNVAAAKRTAFGREVRFEAWIGRELAALQELHRAGAAVPRPIGVAGDALLLAWMGDEEGAAPPLHSLRGDGTTLEALLREVELFLAHDVVHGDLSEYNVLVWEDRPFVIDFPQAVDPRFNRSARSLLERDLRNLAAYFGRCGVALDWRRHAAELWARWLHSDLGRAETPSADDWEFWQQFV